MDDTELFGFLLSIIKSNDSEQIEKILLENSNIIDYSDRNGNTILHLAIIYEKIKIAKILIAYKANPNKLNKKGHSPLDIANMKSFSVDSILSCNDEINRRKKLEDEFNQKCNNILKLLRNQILENNLENIVNILNDNHYIINYSDKEGNTILHFAIYNFKIKAVKLLIKYGADLNKENNKELSPLDIAYKKCYGIYLDPDEKNLNIEDINEEKIKQLYNSIKEESNMTQNNIIDENKYIKEFEEKIIRSKFKQKTKNHLYEKKEIEDLTIEDYEQPEISDTIRKEIKELQGIANSIEKKVEKSQNIKIPENLKIDYRNSLNKMQLLAATTINGPLLIIAGAGTGKTRTIVYRVAYLVENNIPPQNILLLTFTRKAANEMISRATSLLNNINVQKIMGGTFHSFSNHILRRYSHLLGISPNFTIIDTTDSADIIDLIRRECNFYKKDGKAFPRKSSIYKVISYSRNCNKTIEEIIIDTEKDYLRQYIKEIKVIAKLYNKYKSENNIFDYDDLMETLRDFLISNQKFLSKVQDNFTYIMVDEFQDTNIVQKEIIDLIAGKYRNIVVVGDDFQSIYAFRGARFENILRFPQTYPDCKIIKIEENYRSNQSILKFSNCIIDNAILGYKKNLFSKHNVNYKPVVRKFYSQRDEAEFVVSKILEIREKNIELNNIAVLYRATYHSNFIQAELLKRNINYVVFGGIRFIERSHIKDIIAYLRIILNPYDFVAWNRILKLIHGIGNVLASQIVQIIKKNYGKFVFNDFKNKKFYKDLKELGETLTYISDSVISISEKIEILRKYYYYFLKNRYEDYKIRLIDIDVLYQLSNKYNDLEKFLTDLALDPPTNKFQDRNTPIIEESEDRPLVLSTVHSAKGLEWHTVFVIHLLDGLFPSVRALKNIKTIEEERRLFYVSCTRAKEKLYLTMPSYVRLYDGFCVIPSRFVVEVDKKCYNQVR